MYVESQVVIKESAFNLICTVAVNSLRAGEKKHHELSEAFFYLRLVDLGITTNFFSLFRCFLSLSYVRPDNFKGAFSPGTRLRAREALRGNATSVDFFSLTRRLSPPGPRGRRSENLWKNHGLLLLCAYLKVPHECHFRNRPHRLIVQRGRFGRRTRLRPRRRQCRTYRRHLRMHLKVSGKLSTTWKKNMCLFLACCSSGVRKRIVDASSGFGWWLLASSWVWPWSRLLCFYSRSSTSISIGKRWV